MVKNMLPILPNGVRVIDRTNDLDMLQRSKSKYIPYIETLKIIEATKCIEMDVKDHSKNKITAIKTGIRNTAKAMKFTHHIRFAQQNGTLYIWSNK